MTSVPARERDLAIYWEAAGALLDLIGGVRFTSHTERDRRNRALARLARVHMLLDILDRPERRYPVIHVTGTSGKGSTSKAIASILTAAGYRVGLRTSPYLQVATEKLQIGASLIDAVSFARLVHDLLACSASLTAASPQCDRYGYAEIWTALAFQWFAQRHVDIAVIEVGAGGRFDATNVIDPIVSVITTVGLDHVVSLGPTIEDIAWHKAGIIKAGSVAVIGRLPQTALSVILREAESVAAPLIHAASVMPPTGSLPGMLGQFQRDNAVVAFGAITALRQQGYHIADEAVSVGLASARLPGRLEKMPGANGRDVWIDGAHNADKIAALARETSLLSPDVERPVIVLGVLGTKDAGAIARGIMGAASAIVTTEPSVTGKRALGAAALARVIQQCGFAGDVYVEPAPEQALACAGTVASERGASILATGSMYLAGRLRRLWYADDDVIWQRTPWPEQL